MIRKYIFGQPIRTGAVVKELPVSAEPVSEMRLEVREDTIVLSARMEEEDIVYGLGEQVRGINKRGFTYISNASDDPHHTEDKHSLYGAHNFLLMSGSKTFGIFIDDPGKVVFDVGETRRDQLVITAGKDCVVYFIEGGSLKDIVRQFRRLIGRSYIAPRWAFGYQQSRWGYRTAEDIREVSDGNRKNWIPLDAVYLDNDYMENYPEFTVDAENFPDFPAFVREMKEQKIHLVPIIDAGVKIEKDYPVYEEGVRDGHFCKDVEGRDFVAAVWPGRVHFPDVLNAQTRAWFGGK